MTLAGGVGVAVGAGAGDGRRGVAQAASNSTAMDGSASAQPRHAAVPHCLKAPAPA
jgi:hypothetical protein